MSKPAQVKTCSKCQLDKDIVEFSKNKRNKDGLCYWCKKCTADASANWLNKPENKKKRDKYLSKPETKARISKANILWYQENKNRVVARRNYIRLHPEFTKNPQLWYFNSISRRKNFNLTYQQLLDSNHCQNCCFCGTKLKFTKTERQASGNQNASLDRIDSSKGYEVGNIQWTCWDCNQLKSSRPKEKFIYLCNLIAKHNPINVDSQGVEPC